MTAPATAPLSRWGKIGVVGFFVFLLAFGGMVEFRSALLTRRMGDLDVFLRAAWAVRNDADIYAITSDNDWHYLYPPLYAILMTPLADPPKDADPTGYVPYRYSVAICFLLSLLSLFVGVHVLASAMEERIFAAGQPAFCRRWWLLRILPVVICFLPMGHTLMRGQVNVIVLAMLCAATAGWIRGQSFRAGAWLAFAICIKVIPVYLLVYPLWKRDARALLGCAAGCFVGLVLIPMAVFGPDRAKAHYDTYAKAFFGPLLNLTKDERNKEEIAQTDSVGVRNALHNWMYPDASERPDDMHAAAKLTYLALGFVMTLLTLWPGTWRKSESTTLCAHQFAGLIVLMTFFSPVSHSHYLLFCLPVVMSLLAYSWQGQPTLRVPWLLMGCFIVFNVTMAIAYLPGLEILKDRCAALFATLPLWVIPVVQAWRGSAGTVQVALEMPRQAA
jgi:alpha-1,2-mannosyltransferase